MGTRVINPASFQGLFNVGQCSATLDPASAATNTGNTNTITVPGANLGDLVLVSFSLDLQGITLSAYVSAANTVSVRVQNGTAGTLDLASGTVRGVVLRPVGDLAVV